MANKKQKPSPPKNYTVDAVYVAPGRWEKHPDFFGVVRCSVCRDCIVCADWPGGKKWNYCPNCGAKMDGGKAHV